MNLTSLSEQLLSDSERDSSDKGFIDSYDSFKNFFKELPSFAIYFDKANNYANTANTAYLMCRLIDENEFTGKVFLVYDKNDKKLYAKIKENLPFFESSTYTHISDSTEVTSPFVLCGGGEQSDSFWEKLSTNVRYVMTIRPYLDAGDFSFIKIRHSENNEWITFFTDTISMNQPFSMRNFYINTTKLKIIPENIKKYWSGLYKNLENADTILNSEKVSVFSISGLATDNPATDRGDNCVLILVIAALVKLKSDGQTSALVFTDYTITNDSHFSLLQSFCDIKKDSSTFLNELKVKYPHASEADLKTGLLNPLLQKRSELTSVLDKIVFSENPKSFDSGKLYICPIGNLPYDYIAALYAKSSFVFFESCDYTNLAINLGVPYLQKSIETYSSYPDFINPNAATHIDSICEIFKNDISVYTCSLNKGLNTEINTVSDFLLKPESQYFTDLSLYAQGKSTAQSKPGIINDKLAASAGVFHMLYMEMNDKPQKHVLFRNSNFINFDFEELYRILQDYYEKDKKTLNLSRALKGMRISSYFTALAGGNDFIVSLDSDESIILNKFETEEESPEDKEACGISIINAKSTILEGGTFEVRFSDWHGGNNYGIYIDGKFDRSDCLLNIPWLKFSDVNFSVITAENNMPIKGSVGGTFGRTNDYPGVNFVIDLNYQNGLSRIMAAFRQPLTAFDAFGAIAGGVDFNSLLPAELLNVVKLGLSELIFYYDKNNNQITSMSFSFENSSETPWVLWKKDGKNLLIARPSISVTVNSPGDMANRQILLFIGAFVDIGINNEIGQLWLNASYPPFKAELRMASEEIDLGKLLKLFDCNLDLNTTIIDLCMQADFGNHVYQLSAAVGCDWEIANNFNITGLSLHIIDKQGKFAIGFAGAMRIFNCIDIGVAVGYNDGVWKLFAQAKLNDNISMNDLVNTYKSNNDLIMLSENEDNPMIADLKFALTKSDSKVDFEISAYVKDWKISILGNEKSISASGAVGRKDNSFYGNLTASVDLLGADLNLTLNYGTTTNFQLQWGNFTGNVVKTPTETTAVINLKNFSIGEMIETFTGWMCGSKFSLDTPWDILNTFIFDINLIYDFRQNQFKIEIHKEFDLGFGKLNSIIVIYDPDATDKIDVQLSVKYAWESQVQKIGWDASKPGTAPSPAGRGNSYFELRYLAVGQKVKFFKDGYNPKNTDEAITYLIDNTKPETFPAFDENSGMLIATDFGILKDGNSYFLDAALVFYDPALFALRIKLAGTAAKIFDGFFFEIIYAKLSETLGVFKSTIVLPSKFRQFDVGAYSITLPDFYIEIYTNGDFKIDIGFPKNGDFSRSFSLSGIVPPGIPITGSAGFYFGKLSQTSAESAGVNLPQSDKGMFNPAIIFGIGLRIGIGKSISYGILSGGFSLTINTILEGVIAKWNPYDKNTSDESWYYYLKGSASLIGNVYGKIDFAIISASVNITINITVAFVYETCRAIQLAVSAYIQASASLTINLGFFKISIEFSFKVQVKESFTIGENSKAPWDLNAANGAMLFAYPKSKAACMNFSNLQPDRINNINANLSMAITAAADEYSEKEKLVIGNVILTIKSGKDFDTFAETLIYWIIAAAYGNKVTKTNLSNFYIKDDYLAGIEAFLEQRTTPVSCQDAETFLEEFFIVNIVDNTEDMAKLSENESIKGAYFPLPPKFKLAAVNGEVTEYEYILKDYNSINENATKVFKEIFNKLAIVIEDETKEKSSVGNSCMSVAEWVFGDWFAIAASHIIRSMRRKLRDIESSSIMLKDMIEKLNEGYFYDELSGMLSRFFLHGLRLPVVANNEKLIQPNKKGLWVSELGGELILPREAGIFALTGQAFQLPKTYSTGKSYKINITSEYKSYILPKDFSLEIKTSDGSARDVEAIEAYMGTFSLKHAFKEVKAEFSPEVISFSNPTKIKERYIWTIPESLKAYFNSEYLAYPIFNLYLTKYDTEIRKRIISYQTLALVEFSVCATDTKGVYIIGSASKRTIDILQKIITSSINITNTEILNSSGFTNNGSNAFFAISQINMSTETRPPENSVNMIPFIDTLRLLWKALVTNNGGYILTYRDSDEAELGDNITLAITFDITLENANEYLPLINAVSSDTVPEDSEALTAFTKAYTIKISSNLPTAEIAEAYCTDVRRIAENNTEIILNSDVEWDFKNIVKQSGETAEVLSFTAKPYKGESLSAFAERNYTTPAYALWLNRYKSMIFDTTQNITLIVELGHRISPGSENTYSKINESYIITRDKLPEVSESGSAIYAETILQNNYSLLCYGVKDNPEISSPYSYDEVDNSIIYNITMPTDQLAGGEYKSHGLLIQNYFRWVDYYGNKLIPEFYSARLVGYQDSLLGLSKWQSIGTYWNFKEDDRNRIWVTFSFSKDDYANDNSRKCALMLYKNLLSQISDKNLDIRLKCSIFNKVSNAISKTDLIKKIEQIINFLNGNISEIPNFTLDFAFEGDIIPLELFPLECYFVISRNGCADKGYEEVRDIVYTESLLSFPNDLRDFAENFSNTFKGYIALKSSGDSSIYAYKVSDMSINVKNQDIKLFLPRPISNVLVDRNSIFIKEYANGEFKTSQEKSFRAVDLNIWLSNALKFADNVLSADIVSAARLADCDYNNLLDEKKSIANKLSKRLSVAFKDVADNNVPIEATELFRQRILGSLSSYYKVKAITALPTDVKGLPENSVFFGNVTDSKNNPLSYSSPKLKNGEKQNLVIAISGEEIVFDSNGAVLPYADLELSFNITHIESNINHVIDDFNDSSWHGKIVDNITSVQLFDDSAVSIPFPLYNFPETPKMVSQDTEEVEDNYKWKYAFTYSRSYNYPQQVCHCKVKFNTGKINTASKTNEEDLFIILAQIDASGEAILKDLNSLAELINKSSSILPDVDTAKKFSDTFKCAEEIISSLSKVEFDIIDSIKSNNISEEEVNFSILEGKYKDDLFCITLDYDGAEPIIENYKSENVEKNIWIFYTGNDDNKVYLHFAAGQAINKRKIVMSEREVLKYQNAISEIYVKQNERLCNKDMNDIFVYTTGIVSFDSAINASCIVERVDLALDKDKNKKLSQRLTEYFNDLCGNATVILQARGSYSNNINGITPIIYPVFSQTKVQITEGRFKDIVDLWIDTLIDWRRPFASDVLTKDECIFFEFIFFSDISDVPILSVKNAYIYGDYVIL